ncbi:ATP-binding protein [uncultured Croceitalea sp.]|uniref:ATP-binding response regulator n=1 Tax=uncultured Croceitalea sp. TaxID=1798908 RepID=UPI0033062591
MSKNLLILIFGVLLLPLLGYGQNSFNSFNLPDDASAEEVNVALDSLEAKMIREFYKHNYLEIVKYSDTAYALTDRVKDTKRHFRISRYLGSTFLRMGDTTRSKKIFSNSLRKAKKHNDSSLIMLAISDLGNFYSETGNKKKAATCYKDALKIIKETPENLRQLCILHYNLSELYLDENNVLLAESHTKELKKYVLEAKLPLLKSGYYLSKGRLHVLRNKPDEAIEAFIRNIDLAKKHDFVDGVIDGYEGYLQALTQKENYKKAYEIKQKLDEYIDERAEVEQAAAINEVTARMNVEQYKQELKAKNLENEINRQKAERNKIIVYITIGASLILTIFLISTLISIRNRKKLVKSLRERNFQFLEAKKKAEELSNVKTNFLSAISHELRTPLYGIIGIASILKEDVKLQKHKEDISSLKFSADYLLSMVNDLLFLNKLEVFKNEKLECQPFKLRELVKNIVNSLEFMRAKNNNVFEINIDENVPSFLKGDYVKLSQILMNLIGNACKFTEEGTVRVHIDVTTLNEHSTDLHFCIADNGVGISKEKQSVIFEEFTQDTSITNFQGTGLGLAIVKKLLDIHNAPIELKSEKNVGTEFSFCIQYEIAAAAEFEVVKKHHIVDKHVEGSHILIVDDNRINRMVTRKLLERNSYICSTATNGQEAVDLVRNEIFDMILMDVNMPVLGGLEATSIIREFNTTVPIIALTAIDPVQLGKDIHSIGVNDAIIKPYEVSDFLDTIKQNLVSTMKV